MRFRMLGPLRVRTGAGWMPVAAAQQRVVLAVLLANIGRVVSTERLVDAVWADRAPRRAVNTVQAYVMRLRRLLGDDRGSLIVTRGGGYELRAVDDHVDAVLFERLVGMGKRELDRGRPETGAGRLAKALALWHGPVLADVPASAELAPRAAQLEQVRLAAEEDHSAALLELGRHAEVVENLRRLVQDSPLREQRWALLISALDRCGRRADALDAYQRARRLLREELGLEPGPQLRQAQRTILAADAPRPPVVTARLPVVPAQLPPDVVGFTGRDEDLAWLDGLLHTEGDEPATAVVIAAVGGMAGVGKTALVVHWAHRVRHRFADGQLYVNLRGYAADSPVRPIQALARFLRALGVPPDHVPSDVDEAATAYRSLVASRRILVVLDNARDPGQVRPLLPGGPGCLALVTSRDRLDGLVARDGAFPLTLGGLTGDEASSLLVRLLGTDRVGTEPDAVAELAALCGNLPLALRIAAAKLSASPHTRIDEYTERLGEDRLEGLQTDGDGVRAAVDVSYAALPGDARRLLRLLSLISGPDLTVASAAALTGGQLRGAAATLDRLATAHLIDKHAPGRYGMHDLLRHYAAERAAAEESETGRHAALDRLHEHYQRQVSGAAALLYPGILRLPQPETAPAAFATKSAALTWLDTERANLVATIVHTARCGPREVAWRLVDGLRGYFIHRMHLVDWHVAAEAALAAADADGDQHGLTTTHLGLASLHLVRERPAEAIHHYRRAVDHAERAGWPLGSAAALGNIGLVYLQQGQLTAAVEHLCQSQAVRERLEHPVGVAIDVDNLGAAYRGLGRLELAAQCHAQAAAVHQRAGSTITEAEATTGLGIAYHALGRLHDARTTLSRALTALTDAGDRYTIGHTYHGLADVHRDLGDHATALDLARTATAIAREIGNRSLDSAATATIAGIHHQLGNLQESIDGYHRALELARTAGDRYREVDAVIGLAGAQHAAGQSGTAANLAQHGLALAQHGEYRLLEGLAHTRLAAVHLDRGDPRTAVRHADQALHSHTETGHRLGQAQAHLVAASAKRHLGQHTEATAHDAAARALLAGTGADPPCPTR
ncbi:MAG: BTAD domain-containing putative transcriptional regulator [Labedaea sp.]